MKKLLIPLAAFLSVFVFTQKASALMHTGNSSQKSQEPSSLTDEQYKILGEEWMEQMMGNDHDAQDKQIEEMMGKDFLEQMHILMGKRSQTGSSNGMIQMLGMGGTMGSTLGFGGIHITLAVITWLALIAFLIAGARFFWNKSGKVR